MPGLTVRPAVAADHAALEDLFRATSMGSSIRLNIERDPDFFAGARVQADEPCVSAAFDESGRAVGMLSAGKRRVWIDGGQRDLRYLCDLRIHRDWQRSTLLARGFRLLKREIFAPGEWAQTLVLEDNLQAIEDFLVAEKDDPAILRASPRRKGRSRSSSSPKTWPTRWNRTKGRRRRHWKKPRPSRTHPREPKPDVIGRAASEATLEEGKQKATFPSPCRLSSSNHFPKPSIPSYGKSRPRTGVR